jgi:hypothetical protein
MPPSQPHADSLTLSNEQARQSVQWLASVAIGKLPPSFDGDKGWGDTKRVWSGIDIKRDGWKLKTHRRYREVEHGRWIRYEVAFPPPDSERAPTVVVHQVLPTHDAATGQRRWQINSSIVAPMQFTARIQRWNLGVRLFSMTVRGQMRLRLSTSATIAFLADYSEVPPALVIDPRVEQAHLELERFEVDRVSHVGGDAAEQWGEVMEELLVERFVRKQNGKLVEKLNRSIEKERDELRFSLTDWLRKG